MWCSCHIGHHRHYIYHVCACWWTATCNNDMHALQRDKVYMHYLMHAHTCMHMYIDINFIYNTHYDVHVHTICVRTCTRAHSVYLRTHIHREYHTYIYTAIAKLQLASKYIVPMCLSYSYYYYIALRYTYYLITLYISKACHENTYDAVSLLHALIIIVYTTIHQRQMCDCVCIYFKSAAAPCSLCEHLKWWHRSWNRVA